MFSSLPNLKNLLGIIIDNCDSCMRNSWADNLLEDFEELWFYNKCIWPARCMEVNQHWKSFRSLQEFAAVHEIDPWSHPDPSPGHWCREVIIISLLQ